MIDARPRRAGRRASVPGAFLGLVAVLLGAVLLAPRPAAAAPLASEGSPSLVFSEVYAPAGSDPATQWFELHNTQPKIDYPLHGLVIETGGGQVTLQTTQMISATGYVLFVFTSEAAGKFPGRVIPVPELGGLNSQADALVLRTPDDNLTIDAVNWGTPDPAWPNSAKFKDVLWGPGLHRLEASKDGKPRTWGRTPADTDTNSLGDWTVHETASPGTRVGARPSFFLGPVTDWATVISSLLLWAVFIIIGIIAYRFERLRDTRTYWQLLLLAPSGLLFYTAIVIVAFSNPGAALSNEQKWLSFPVLAISALFCLAVMFIFRNVARGLLEGE